MFESFFDFLLGWAVNINPVFGLVFITFIITLLITISYKYLTDQHVMKSLKDEIKGLQKDMKKFKDKPEKMVAIQKGMMSKNMKMFKMNFKPMLITMIPLLLLFGWLRVTYDPLGKVIWIFGWFGSYIILTLIFSFVLRKIMKVH